MRADRQPSSAKIRYQSLFVRHSRERRFPINFRKLIKQRSRPAYRTLHLPKRIAAMKFYFSNFTSHCIQRSNLRQRPQLILAQLGHATSQILNRIKRRQAAFPNQRLPRRFAQPVRVLQAETN